MGDTVVMIWAKNFVDLSIRGVRERSLFSPGVVLIAAFDAVEIFRRSKHERLQPWIAGSLCVPAQISRKTSWTTYLLKLVLNRQGG